jgi:hypothetical protein
MNRTYEYVVSNMKFYAKFIRQSFRIQVVCKRKFSLKGYECTSLGDSRGYFIRVS